MDNVTHSLFGALVAEAVFARTSSKRPTRVRSIGLLTSILSNNLPDFDFLYSRITTGKLGYLLHHRGHTHTALGALCLGAFALLIAFGLVALRKISLSRRERLNLAALSFAGPVFHIALDYGNNYGVHPFWPLDDSWYYGDAIFIVEPLLWVVAIPPLCVLAKTRAARFVYVSIFAAALHFGRSRGVLSIVELVVLTNLAVACAFAATRLRAEVRAFAALAGWLLVTTLFVTESRIADSRARAAVADAFATTTVIDVVTTPRPGNPFCWAALILGTDDDRYVARRATVWTAPWKRRACRSLDESKSTAPFEPIDRSRGSVHIESGYAANIGELRELDRKCTVAAFMRYARAPFWTTLDGQRLVGDLRFDRSRAIEFTEVLVPEPELACPRNVPPWTPPRIDLLRPSGE